MSFDGIFAAIGTAHDSGVIRVLARFARDEYKTAHEWMEYWWANGGPDSGEPSPDEICNEKMLFPMGVVLGAMVGKGDECWEWNPMWASANVSGVANAIYDNENYALMPILADALADAGCHHEEILSYCRGSGPFFRGCWVLDMATGQRTLG